MSAKRISQREARRLRKCVTELERLDCARHSMYSAAYPGGVHAVSVLLNDEQRGRLWMANRVGCALVAKLAGNDTLYVYAVPRGDA